MADDALPHTKKGEISGSAGELGRGKIIAGCISPRSHEFIDGITTHDGDATPDKKKKTVANTSFH